MITADLAESTLGSFENSSSYRRSSLHELLGA